MSEKRKRTDCTEGFKRDAFIWLSASDTAVVMLAGALVFLYPML